MIYDGVVATSHRRVHRKAKEKGATRFELWWRVFNLIYFSSVFIIVRGPLTFSLRKAMLTLACQIRSICRLTETSQGQGGYLVSHGCKSPCSVISEVRALLKDFIHPRRVFPCLRLVASCNRNGGIYSLLAGKIHESKS